MAANASVGRRAGKGRHPEGVRASGRSEVDYSKMERSRATQAVGKAPTAKAQYQLGALCERRLSLHARIGIRPLITYRAALTPWDLGEAIE